MESVECEGEKKKKLTYRSNFLEIIDVMAVNINERFCEMTNLKMLSLLNHEQFTSFKGEFLTESLTAWQKTTVHGLNFHVWEVSSQLCIQIQNFPKMWVKFMSILERWWYRGQGVWLPRRRSGVRILDNPIIDFSGNQTLPSPLRRHVLSKCEVYQVSTVVRIPRKAVSPICTFVRIHSLER